jgi:CheY-like chemotaxis protein
MPTIKDKRPHPNIALTVLVVDDYDDTRLMMRQVLEGQGYRVIEALTGIEAVKLAGRERPDLILMDINLPLIDGVNATRRIREIEEMSNVPIVAVSAYDSPDLRDSAITAGCVEYLLKPFDTAQLGSLVNRLLPVKGRSGKKIGPLLKPKAETTGKKKGSKN